MITIELPWPDRDLSPNNSVHWAVLRKAKRKAKSDGFYCAYLSGTLYLGRENGHKRATYTFHPPDKRKRDQDNALASMKAYQDGVCKYFDFDDSDIKETNLKWGDVHPGGKVVLQLEAIE